MTDSVEHLYIESIRKPIPIYFILIKTDICVVNICR